MVNLTFKLFMSHTFPAGHTVTRDDDHVFSPIPHGVNGLSGQTYFTTLVLVLQARQALVQIK